MISLETMPNMAFNLIVLLSALAAAIYPSMSASCPGYDLQCPYDSAFKAHTSVQVTVAGGSCEQLAAEMIARCNGNHDGKWVDPHNGGIYTFVSQSHASDSSITLIKTNHTTGKSPHYLDNQ